MLFLNDMTKISYEQMLLVLAILFLPINNFSIELPIIGKVVSHLFILVGVIFYLHKLFIKEIQLDKFERLCVYFLFVYFFWQCLCTVIGLQEYEYYDLLYLEQMDKLRFLLQELRNYGWDVSDITAIKVWLGFRFVKDCLLNILFSYGTTVWVYHIYKCIHGDSQRSSKVYSHVLLSIGVLCIVMILYSVIEVGYLRGSPFCADILKKVNPLLYKPAIFHGWWPPLLWKNQLRSLFVEPSFFGIVSSFVVPFLFYTILRVEKKFFIIVYSMFSMMLFMTKARTALALFLIQGVLLLLYVLVLNPYYIRKVLKIIFTSLFSFIFALYLMSGFRAVSSNFISPAEFDIQSRVSNYISDNVTSVVGNKRSNSARFASVRSAFETGLQHPLFGVGRGLGGAYINANFTEADLNNNEVRQWSNYLYQNGVLKSSPPILNELATEIALFGVPGLIMYLLPVAYVFYGLIKVLKRGLNAEIACVSIAYIGSLAAMLSNGAFLPYYILTGLMVTFLRFAEKGDNISHETC